MYIVTDRHNHILQSILRSCAVRPAALGSRSTRSLHMAETKGPAWADIDMATQC